eukprot:NODE_1790_length_1062_cov_301.346574.p1 GENE.NODE_1790_length_1062_cov_301.346574~~NODE_1790_length_1062_cov_301.346574.p1  ORF type:complete len:215 (-),score=56.09 NODE_1790_length_1062_cov_301.346574:329-973(-)
MHWATVAPSRILGCLRCCSAAPKKLTWLINTDVGMSDAVDFCTMAKTPPKGELNPHGMCTNQVTDKFGYGTSSAAAGFLTKNQVFRKRDFLPLMCDLQKLKKAGKPAVIRRSSFEVVENPWWNIIGGWTVDIVFVYNDRIEDFERALPHDTQASLKAGHFSKFPNMATTFENPAELTKYTPAQVNLLAAQAEYAILQNRDMFEHVLGGGGAFMI